jgi:Endonuclease-reverse transcriptase
MIKLASQKKIMVMGDFNFADLNWVRPETLDDSHLFMKCVNDNFLVQSVEDCTRGKNVLDLVLTSEENMVENLVVGEPFGTSDHQIIRWTFIACKETVKESGRAAQRFNYFKADYDKIRDDCKVIDWERVKHEQNVESAWKVFKESIGNLRDKWIPMNVSKKGKCKWVTKAVVRHRRAKVKAWKKFQQHKTEINHANYKNKLRIAVASCTQAKRNYEFKLANDIKDNNKSFFAYVRNKQRTKERVGPLKDLAGKLVVDDKETACLLNTYFSSVFTVEDKTNMPDLKPMFVVSDKCAGVEYMKISEETVERNYKNLR